MKKYWIDFQDCMPDTAMTFWVHRAVGEVDIWSNATEFDPPRQPRVAGKGYPVFNVELDGFTFVFSSLEEIRECVNVLERKLLPRTLDLSDKRQTAKGPNSHWLSRLPAKVKPWQYRQRAAAYLREALASFEQDLKH